MKKLLFVTLLATLLPAGPALAGETASEIAVLVADQSDANGNPMPTAPAITGVVGLLAAETGLNLVLHPYPWRRAQMLAENGEGLLYGAAATPERQRMFNFSKPLYAASQWLVTPARSTLSFQRWEDLRGKVISISSGGRYGTEFEEHRGKTFTVEDNAATIASRLKMLSIGRVDAVMLDSFRGAAQLEARLNCLYPGDGKWTVVDKPLDMEPVLLAVSKSSQLNSALPVLNEAIDRLTKSRSIQKLLEKRLTATSC
ncbi:MAG: transporter substrate-binding domain-containing protein [Pseudomonadota bacterium]